MYEHEHPWEQPAAGLRMVAHAMIVQLCLVVFTLLVIAFMVSRKKSDGMEGIAMLLALVGLIAQLILVTGVFKFSSQPVPRPSAGLAQAAGVLGLVGIAFSGYVLIVLMQVSSVGPTSDYEAIASAMEAAERLPKIEVAAAAIGFLAMVLLMAAASSVAGYFRNVELERKAKTALAMVLLAAAIYAFVKLGVTPREPSSAIAALVMITIVQIAAFVTIFGTVRALAVVLRGPIPAPDLPRARSL